MRAGTFRICVLFALFSIVYAFGDRAGDKHILYVSSTSNQLAPNYHILLECNHHLGKMDVVLCSSYLDLGLFFPEKSAFEHIREKLEPVYDKICSGYFDVIVPIGQDAIDAMAAISGEIPDKTAMVPCGFEINTEKLLSLHRNMTAVSIEANVTKCVEFAIHFAPHVKNVVYLGNSTKEGAVQKESIRHLEKQYPKIHFHAPDNNSTTISELMNLIEMQDGQTIVILHSWFNKDTTNLISLEYLKTRLGSLEMKIFVMSDGMNWIGAFGGFHASSQQVGFAMAHAIMDAITRGNACTGEHRRIEAHPFANYYALRKNAMLHEKLPEGCQILGEEDFILRHQGKLLKIFIGLSGLLLMLLVVCIYIVFYFRRRSRILRAMLNSASGKILVSDSQNRIYCLHYYDYLHFFPQGKKLSELPIVVTDDMKKHALQVLEHGEPSVTTHEIEGRVYKVEQSFIPAYEIGFDAVLWQMVDITEYAMETRNSRKKAQFKKNYVAMVSHELRTPLNVIVGLTAQLSDESLSGEQRKAIIEDMQIASRALMGLIDETVELAKIEEHTLKMNLAPTDLQEVGEHISNLFAKPAEDKGLYLHWNRPDTEVPLVMLDAQHLWNVLFIIMSNAVKFTKRGGVTLNLSCSYDKEKNVLNARWEVCDTGIGIRDDAKKYIFEPFENANVDHLLRTRKGVGFGLPVARNLARYIGGNITFTTAENKGTTFVISFKDLPLATGNENITRTENPTIKAKPGCKVLLVDESPLTLKMMSAVMESLGFETVTASSSAAALAMLKQFRADIVFTDYCMADFPGDELAQKIHCSPSFAGVKVVAVTGDMECGNKSGDVFDFILYKPVTREMLFTCLKETGVVEEDKE